MVQWLRRLFGRDDRPAPAPERTITMRVVTRPAAPLSPSAPRERKTPLPTAPGPIALKGRTDLSVTGRTFYQDALRAVADEWRAANPGTRQRLPRVTAALILDPQNLHDRNAVRVEVGGRLVGHLKREDAAAYQPLLRQLVARRQFPTCNGVIRAMGGAGTLFMDLEEFVAPGYRLL